MSKKIESLRNKTRTKNEFLNLKYLNNESNPFLTYRSFYNPNNLENENKKEIYNDNNKSKQNLHNNNINLYNKIFKENNKYNNNSFNKFALKNKKKSFDNNIIQINPKKENVITKNHKTNLKEPEESIANNKRQINKSNSYLIEANNFEKSHKDKISSQDFKNRYKIYKSKKENEKKTSALNCNLNNILSIKYIMELVDYKGSITNFPKYLKELKLKSDITTMAQNMIKNEINNDEEADKYFEEKEKNKKLLNAYKLIFNRLKAEKDIKSTKKEYNNFYNDIYLSKYSS